MEQTLDASRLPKLRNMHGSAIQIDARSVIRRCHRARKSDEAVHGWMSPYNDCRDSFNRALNHYTVH